MLLFSNYCLIHSLILLLLKNGITLLLAHKHIYSSLYLIPKLPKPLNFLNSGPILPRPIITSPAHFEHIFYTFLCSTTWLKLAFTSQMTNLFQNLLCVRCYFRTQWSYNIYPSKFIRIHSSFCPNQIYLKYKSINWGQNPRKNF